jgi:pimeloyl-ACP methyl ester carboxylesterase
MLHARPVLLLTLASLCVACSFVSPALARDRRGADPRPAGRMVDLGGWRLHVQHAGRGGPAVVIEAGSGDFSFDWTLVTGPVSRFTTVCTYDRAGYAWSDPGPGPRTFRQLTWELHTALRKAGVPAPYVLVGHSYGGFLVRAFAQYYPTEVVGVVLAESMHEDSRVIIDGKAVRIRDMATGRAFPPLTTRFTPPVAAPAAPAAPGAAAPIESPFDRLPPEQQRLHAWATARSSYETAVRGELDWSPEEIERMYRARASDPHPLGDRPLVVVTRAAGGYEDVTNATAAELEAERLRLQADLASLSTNGTQIVDARTGHNVHLEDPAQVVDAIRRVVEAVRHHARVATPTADRAARS